jgi:hypothetical protein
MTSLLIRSKIIALVVLCMASCSIYNNASFRAYNEGAATAARDIASGRYSLYGSDSSIWASSEEIQKINRSLLKRYGIQSKSDKSVDPYYVNGYNTMMHSAARERFGSDFYERAMKDN